MSKSEYQEKYCGARGGHGGGGGGGGAGGRTEVAPIKANEDSQPVGGRSQVRARAAAAEATQGTAMAHGLPAYDESFVATVYSDTERATHRIQPGWRDPRWSNPTRAGSSTLYDTAERDPAHRQQFYVYKSTLVDSLETPCVLMPAPDVHKLRYMHNNYMSPDDWY